jgi:hypothetical protein
MLLWFFSEKYSNEKLLSGFGEKRKCEPETAWKTFLNVECCCIACFC